MTVRVWMRPTDLGEAGYHIDYDLADDYERLKNGTLLLSKAGNECGRVQADRWDAVVILETEENE